MSEGRWIYVEHGHHCCSECSEFTEVAWLYFATPTRWTLALCEGCVERVLEPVSPPE
jgi:hypothetical protein